MDLVLPQLWHRPQLQLQFNPLKKKKKKKNKKKPPEDFKRESHTHLEYNLHFSWIIEATCEIEKSLL